MLLFGLVIRFVPSNRGVSSRARIKGQFFGCTVHEEDIADVTAETLNRIEKFVTEVAKLALSNGLATGTWHKFCVWEALIMPVCQSSLDVCNTTILRNEHRLSRRRPISIPVSCPTLFAHTIVNYQNEYRKKLSHNKLQHGSSSTVE